jgi:hypothetical protein
MNLTLAVVIVVLSMCALTLLAGKVWADVIEELWRQR